MERPESKKPAGLGAILADQAVDGERGHSAARLGTCKRLGFNG